MIRRIFPRLLLIVLLCRSGSVLAQPHRQVFQSAAQSELLLSPAAAWPQQARRTAQPEQVLVRLAAGHALTGKEKDSYWEQSLGGSDYLLIVPGGDKRLPENTEWFATVQPQWKMDAAVRSQATGTGSATVLVAVLPAAVAEWTTLIRQMQGVVLREVVAGKGYYEVRLPKNKLYELAAWYGTLSISRRAEPQPLNLESKIVTRTELLNAPLTEEGYGLQGEGMVIGVGDNASGIDHVDLRDRIINYNPWRFAEHGIHINGIVGGAGIMNVNARGFAPRATLIDHAYDQVWAQTEAMQASHGMSITNNSYAAVVGNCDHAGVYDGYSALLDSLSLAIPNVLHVFAAGNDGLMTCGSYPPGFHTVVGTYQAAKNVLVVGNMTKQTTIGSWSSRGPVKDGRIKPEVCAVGTSVFSCKNDDTYQIADGTSMASPQVAGLAALLSQRYKQLHGGTLPPSDLLKALLMNGATDLGPAGPDFTYGFGAVNGMRSAQMLDSGYYFRDVLITGGVKTHTIQVPAGISRLKVLLYWHDAPASMLPARKLVNDLDLEVQAGGITYLPFVLDTSATALNQPATTGTDRLNNVEQVVVAAPAAGSWDLVVKGFAIPEGPQSYVLVYVFESDDLVVTYPHAGATAVSGDSLRIAWEAPPGSQPFTIEWSNNGGANWTLLNNEVPSEARNFAFQLPALNANNCLVRVSRNSTGQTFTTEAFLVQKPVTVKLADSTRQCPGAFAFTWNSPGAEATAYQILQKKGTELVPIDTVGAGQLSFTLTGLRQDSTYYVAVKPFIGSKLGKQSNGLRRTPNSGLCNLPLFQGDLALTEIISPQTGRLHTSTALGSEQPLVVRLWNLSPVPATNYTLYYQLNNGSVQSVPFNTPADAIAPAANKVVTVSMLDLSAPDNYLLRVWVVNHALADPVPVNDTIRKIIRQLENQPVVVSPPWQEGFEAFPVVSVQRDTLGLGPDSRWDYFNSNDSGRLRSWVNDAIPVSGNRAISLDAALNQAAGSSNLLLATFNLAAYAGTGAELRLEFDYKLHGIPKNMDSNRVWIRGSDTSAWQPLFVYDTSAAPGTLLATGSLSLNDALLAAGQSFSTATQIAFGQKDTSLIAANDYGNGLTIDNLNLYRAENDVMLKRLVQPDSFYCGGASAQPVTVVVYNTVQHPQSNVAVYYRLNGGTPVAELIPAIPAKDSLTWTFVPTLELQNPGLYTLDVFIAAAGDTYPENDSILDYQIRVQPVINSFPYLEDFEADNGGWYAAGQNSSWFWGAPNGGLIHQAASGAKAWMTNAGAGYNSNEQSFLYSPCLDISGMTQPVLSFSKTLELENCGSNLCDYLQLEYSFDAGATWQKLGLAGQGTNWYNNAEHQVWSKQEGGRWHVSSIPLPLPPPGSLLRLRYRFQTDPGTNLEGAAIDDIHVFDLKYPIQEAPAGPVVATLAGDTLVRFLAGNKILAEINTGNQNLGTTSLQAFLHTDLIAPMMMQYIFPRSFALHASQQPADSVLLRLYVLESEAEDYFAATGCVPCSQPSDIYRLGATRYHDPDESRENGTMTDNENGIYTYYDQQLIRWVPYDKGYYAEFKTSGLSEYWFNDSGLVPLPVVLSQIEARNEGNRNRITWQSSMESSLSHYELEKSKDGSSFVFLSTSAAKNKPATYTSFDDQPYVGYTYYRLKMVFLDGTFLYSPTVKALFQGGGANGFTLQVFPNPAASQVTVQAAGSAREGWLQLTDVSGRIILRQPVYYGYTTLDVSGLAKGVYVLKYGDAHHTATVKLEKE